MSEPTGKMTFYCPHCGQKLSFLDGSVIKMLGRLHAPDFSCETMFYLPARLGQYGAVVGEGVNVKEGARVEFACFNGACRRAFSAAYDESLAEVKMVDETGRQFVVVFNRIFGRKATFLVDLSERQLVGTFGEDARESTPDFGGPLNYFGC